MKKVVIIIIFVALALILVLGVLELTGFSQLYGRYPTGCKETDKGKDIFTKGITTYENRPQKYIDECKQPSRINEYYCTLLGRIKLKTFRCPSECKDGACIK